MNKLPGKPIPNFHGYRATEDGEIYSEKCSRYLVQRKRWDGRLDVHLCVSGKMKRKLVHQLILETFVGPKPAGTEVCHNNDVHSDNRLSNLRWDTRLNNMREAFGHGLYDRTGEHNGRAKLNHTQVRIVRKLLRLKSLTQKEIGNIFGVSRSAICWIKTGTVWAQPTPF